MKSVGDYFNRRPAVRGELRAIKCERDETASQYMHRVHSSAEKLHTLNDVLDDSEVASIALQGLSRWYQCSLDAFSMADIAPDKVKYALLQKEG